MRLSEAASSPSFQSRFSPISVTAASALPPPRPASDGTCLRRSTATSLGSPRRRSAVRQSRDAAFHTRLRRSVGTDGSSQVISNGPRVARIVTWSASARDWKIVRRS